ncbi:MAG: TetR/AcrR family transcriptional regulator [Phreatobacter sp.]
MTEAKRPAKSDAPYHHGSLRQALLEAAETILERDGMPGLTLRAAAREAGVSHAAPMNHFGDLTGLLSELAAVGFERFNAALVAAVPEGATPAERMDAIGRAYIVFSRRHPGLFLLMFRSERLDMTRPNLQQAVRDAFMVLSGAVGRRREEEISPQLTLPQAAQIVASWSLVHGFAMLSLDGRFKPVLARLPEGVDEDALLTAIVSGSGQPAG